VRTAAFGGGKIGSRDKIINKKPNKVARARAPKQNNKKPKKRLQSARSHKNRHTERACASEFVHEYTIAPFGGQHQHFDSAALSAHVFVSVNDVCLAAGLGNAFEHFHPCGRAPASQKSRRVLRNVRWAQSIVITFFVMWCRHNTALALMRYQALVYSAP
jgi:hypothetical protein